MGRQDGRGAFHSIYTMMYLSSCDNVDFLLNRLYIFLHLRSICCYMPLLFLKEKLIRFELVRLILIFRLVIQFATDENEADFVWYVVSNLERGSLLILLVYR